MIGRSDDLSRLARFPGGQPNYVAMIEAMRRDDVVLVEGLSPTEADVVVGEIADRLGLGEQLALQAAFASVHGHRSNVGQSFMSVNRRRDYEFISAHSEGLHSIGMQLAAFYCRHNTTDGGYSVLLNVDSDSPVWRRLQDVRVKVDLCGRSLSAAEITMARMRYQIAIPDDLLGDRDRVLAERPSPLAGARFYDVLAPVRSLRSRILDADLNVYWDSVASTDSDAADEYCSLLRALGLLRLPAGGLDVAELDNAHDRRLWRSGATYAELFKGMICRKLEPGELIIQNNLTWAHSASNWTPGSGVRDVAAAFA